MRSRRVRAGREAPCRDTLLRQAPFGIGFARQVNIFRIVAAALPQLLLVLLAGARVDLLGGFNRTDAGFGTVVALFFVTPVATTALVVVEAIRRRRQLRQDGGSRSSRMLVFAIFLLLESLAVNLFILTQLRMH